MRLKLFEEFTTGKRSVSSGVVSWEELRKIVPNSVYLKAKKMYTNVEGNTNLVGDSEVIQCGGSLCRCAITH